MKTNRVSFIKALGVTAFLFLAPALFQVTSSHASTDAEEAPFIEVLKGNLFTNTDISKYGAIYVSGKTLTGGNDAVLRQEAARIRTDRGIHSMKSGTYDINSDGTGELFLLNTDTKKAQLIILGIVPGTLDATTLMELPSVDEVRSLPKNAQIIIKQSPGKKTVKYLVCSLASGRMTVQTTYAKKGKKYKKDKKKITAKAFNKFVKKYKKQARVDVSASELAASDGCIKTAELFSENGRALARYSTESGQVTRIFIQNPTAKNEQNRYVSFESEKHYVGDGTGRLDAAEALTRLVFGPLVNEAFVASTYMERDYKAAMRDGMDGAAASPYLCEVPNSYNHIPEFIYKADNVTDLSVVKDSVAVTDESGTAHTARVSRFTFNGETIEVTVYTGGELDGRIRTIRVFPQGSSTARSVYDYHYGAAAAARISAVNWYSDDILARVKGGLNDNVGIDSTVVKQLRSLKINAGSSALVKYAETVQVDQNVAFRLYSISGTFYSTRADGSDWNLQKPEQDSDATNLAAYLNPTAAVGYGDPVFPKGIFWKPS